MRVISRHGIRVEPEVWQLVEDRLERDARLEPGEVLAQTDVRPSAEGNVLTGVTEDVERVRIGIAVRVAVGRTDGDADVGARGDLRVAELGVGLRRTHDEQ